MPRVQLRLSVSESTYELLAGLAPEFSVVRRSTAIGGIRTRVDIGPLIEMVAENIEELLRGLPPELQSRFRRRRKLTSAQVRIIRASTEPLKCLSSEYGVNISKVSKIRNGTAYKWVK